MALCVCLPMPFFCSSCPDGPTATPQPQELDEVLCLGDFVCWVILVYKVFFSCSPRSYIWHWPYMHLELLCGVCWLCTSPMLTLTWLRRMFRSHGFCLEKFSVWKQPRVRVAWVESKLPAYRMKTLDSCSLRQRECRVEVGQRGTGLMEVSSR